MRHMIALITAVALTAVLSACSETDEGTAESAGKKIDQMVQDTKTYADEKIQQASEGVSRAGEDAEKALSGAKEYTGEKMQEAGEALEKAGEEMKKDN